MSSDATIKFDGVEGESVKPKGEVDVLSWAWSAMQPSGAAGGTGSGKGKAVPGDFSFTHMYDKASPVLAKRGCVKIEAKRVKAISNGFMMFIF